MSRKVSNIAPFAEVGKLYEKGMSKSEIAKHFGVDSFTIHSRLQTYQRRKKSEKKKTKTCEFVLTPEQRPLRESRELEDCFKNPLLVVEGKRVVVDRLDEFWQREGVEIA